jgi:ABC-type lipopolysaccharide export system ATPase subunit
MTEGKILRSGRPDDLINDSDVRRLYLGERFSL